MKKIIISSKHKKDIALELSTTKQTVQMSLDFVFNSPLAIKIRKRAKELLLIEVAKID